MTTSLVVTTIQPPTAALKALIEGAVARDWGVIVIGDEPGPDADYFEPGTFFSLDQQRDLNFSLGELLPTRHYSRKNVGYLIAASRGCDVLVESDDDNFPLESFWADRSRSVECEVVDTPGWTNIYGAFTNALIWPRGLPLDAVRRSPYGLPAGIKQSSLTLSPIQQGLADGDPDVDAIYRLLIGDFIEFERRRPIALLSNCWCPFNSQNTTWFREAFPLLYLPSTCSFRMTDIWRSYVAQRIAWVQGWSVSFHSATVRQERNAHDLLRDFEGEIAGYLGNDRIRSLLSSMDDHEVGDDILDALHLCYALLTEHGFFRVEEMALVNAWIADIKTAMDETPTIPFTEHPPPTEPRM